MTYNKPDALIHVIVRTILTRGDSIILCRQIGKEYFFLPGGHLENGETLLESQKRELAEEIKSKHEFGELYFVDVCDNFFVMNNGETQHEINLIYSMELLDTNPVISNEEHIEFIEINIVDLQDCNVKPAQLKEKVIKFLVK